VVGEGVKRRKVEDGEVLAVPLGDGHLRKLEDEADSWELQIGAAGRDTTVEKAALTDVEMGAPNEVLLPPSAVPVPVVGTEGSRANGGNGVEGRMSLKRLLETD
jgi:uncharacterized protein YjlB